MAAPGPVAGLQHGVTAGQPRQIGQPPLDPVRVQMFCFQRGKRVILLLLTIVVVVVVVIEFPLSRDGLS